MLAVHSCYHYSYAGHALQAASGDVIAPRCEVLECAHPTAAYLALFAHAIQDSENATVMTQGMLTNLFVS